jgi:chromate reductase
MSGAKILAFAGSLREGSLNKKLLALAVEGAREAGAEVTVIDLRDYPMPIYDGDLEASDGVPENARRIHALLEANDGLLIATPENNYSLSAVLKNTIDWASRPVDDHPTLHFFRGKTAALVSAAGTLGGKFGMAHLRGILSVFQIMVIPEQYGIVFAFREIDENGNLKAEHEAPAKAVGARLAEVVDKMYG